MNIWVDANGWPIPPQVLLVCLIAEILYFRGWRLLVKAEQRKTARAKAHPVLTGFHAGQYQLDNWLWRGTYFLGAIFAFLLAASASTGRHGPIARGRSARNPIVAGVAALGAHAHKDMCKSESKAGSLPDGGLAATTCHFMRSPGHRYLGVALAYPL